VRRRDFFRFAAAIRSIPVLVCILADKSFDYSKSQVHTCSPASARTAD
jgi:hypothetical protein